MYRSLTTQGAEHPLPACHTVSSAPTLKAFLQHIGTERVCTSSDTAGPGKLVTPATRGPHPQSLTTMAFARTEQARNDTGAIPSRGPQGALPDRARHVCPPHA